MKRFGFLFALLLVSPLASAQTSPKGKVTQVFRDAERAVVTFDKADQVTTSDRIVITTADGEACEGEVVEKTGAKAMVELKDCSSFKDIKSGAVATKSEFSSAVSSASKKVAPAPRAESNEGSSAITPRAKRDPSDPSNRFRGAVGAYYSLGRNLEFSDASQIEGSNFDSGSATFTLQNAFGIMVEGLWSRKHSWGVGGGLSTETKREFKKYKEEMDGVTTEFDDNGDGSLRFTHLYVNAIYRWDGWYLPFGLNYSIVSKDKAPAVFNDMSGTAGIQVGVGYYVTDMIALEFMVRGTSVDLGEVEVGTDTYWFNQGVLVTGNFGAKFVF